MGLFSCLALLGGFGAIASFMLGFRATSGYGLKQQELTASGWSWQGVFAGFVFLTILAAPLAH
jgi:hypothetical protein